MNTLIPVLLLAAMLAFSSCNRVDSPVVAQPGNMSGFVNVNDEDGFTVDDLSGVQVTLDGTSIRTNSDSSGHWRLREVPAGVYSISYSKKGFGTNKIVSYNFAGNGEAYIPLTQISAIPTLTSFVASVGLDTNSEIPTIVLRGTVSQTLPLSMNRTVILFFGRNATVSDDPQSYVAQSLAFVPSGSNEFSQLFSTQQLRSMGFKPGQRVFVTSYAASKQYYRYIDVATGRYRYCGISDKKQNYMEFLVP